MACLLALPLLILCHARHGAAKLRTSVLAKDTLEPRSKWALPAQAPGYPIAFPLLDSAVYAVSREDVFAQRIGVNRSADASGEVQGLAKGMHRLIMYDVQDHAGLDDRIFVMMHMLSIATVVKATLAFPSPAQLLGRKHGDSLANWWDEYYFTDPPIHRFQDVQCSSDVKETVVTHAGFVDKLDAEVYGALMDTNKPLCLRVKIKYYSMIRGGKTELLINLGLPNVRIWTSNKVAHLMQEVIREVPQLNNDYNVAHLRLGDKQQSCVTATNVEHAIMNLTKAHPQGGRDKPWLVMSDGDEAFFSRLLNKARRDGVKLITEMDVKVLKQLKDNYLRYTVLSCFCGGADLQLWNYKQIGGRCNLKRSQSVASARFACRDSDEAFVRDAWGPQQKSTP